MGKNNEESLLNPDTLAREALAFYDDPDELPLSDSEILRSIARLADDPQNHLLQSTIDLSFLDE